MGDVYSLNVDMAGTSDSDFSIQSRGLTDVGGIASGEIIRDSDCAIDDTK